MVKNKMGWGEKETNCDIYKGKFVCAGHNGNIVYGILKEINTNQNYVDFMPSIVGTGDNSIAINTDLPTRLSLPISLIRPVPQTLEDYVKEYNNTLKHKKQTKK